MVPVIGLVFALQTPALAGCTTDLECKGDRVCESGICVDSAPPPPPLEERALPTTSAVTGQGSAAPDLLSAGQRLRLARTRATASWVLFGGCVGLGVPASVLGLADTYWVAPTTLGGVALTSGAIGGGLALGGARAARDGAALVGGPGGASGAFRAGAALYGVSLALGAGAVAGGAAQAGPPAGAAGLGAVTLMATSIVVLEADSAKHRKQMASAGVVSWRDRAPVHVALVVTPGGAGLSGTW